jgi:hypothetical protein
MDTPIGGVSMESIILKRDGSIKQSGKILKTVALNLLSSQISLEKGYSLRSFFEMLAKYSLFSELSAFFPMYTEQYRSCPKSGCDAGYFDYLEFGKTIEMIGVPDQRLEIYNYLAGLQANQASEVRSLQLDGLLDLPLKLGKLKHIVFGDRVDIFEFDTVYTLFEFIDGIGWELSFHATPEQCELRR